MNIEQKIFQRANIDFDKLQDYGFVKSGSAWVYEKCFFNNEFRAVITVNEERKINGNVYETDSNDIFYPLRVESMMAGYVGEVRQEYEKILSDIRLHCTASDFFMFPQTNRLAEAVYQQYGDRPLFPWNKYPDYGVFRNNVNNKWYALVMNIARQKLDGGAADDIVEIMNLKLPPKKIIELSTQDGFFPAYHMNKINWITIVLDDSLSDELIVGLICESYSLVLNSDKSKKTGKNKK